MKIAGLETLLSPPKKVQVEVEFKAAFEWVKGYALTLRRRAAN
jgi:hypothetical protein